jgi:CelD/BcsL family acetyltransferase involved in cellulose biosynthesis
MNARASVDAVKAERLEIVDSSDRLAAIEDQWTRLWRASDALVFQSHGWISAWWRTLKNQQQVALRIGLVWKGDSLVAVLPLAITRRKGVRFLEWAAGAHTDYGDVLCAPECPDAALHRLWTHLCDAGGFDLVLIDRLLPDAAARRFIDAGAAAGRIRLQPAHRREISSRIAGDWQNGAAWVASHPKKTRQNYRRGIKMLGEAGTVRFRLLDPDEPLEPVLDRLAALKRKWLERNAQSSGLFEGEAPALKALVDVMARSGVLRLFVIEVDGVVVAVSVNFVQRDTMMAWVTTYDPDFARASPGMVLIFDYVQWSIDCGLAMVDLLCGGEAFKDRLATQVVELGSVVGAGNAIGSLALLAHGIGRRLLEGRAPQKTPAELS